MAKESPGAPYCGPHTRPRRLSSASSSCSSSHAAADDYDVFLNHRGPDVKGSFVAHLYEALVCKGLNPFLDKKSLVKGQRGPESMAAALQAAKVHVAVISEGYADSRHCLDELVVMVGSGKPVITVFYDVEPAHLRRVESGPFAEAFVKHRSRESVELVTEWVHALVVAADITGFCFRLSDTEGDEVKLKWEVVSAILNEMPCTLNAMPFLQREYTLHNLVGLEDHLNMCIEILENISSIGILSLVGMGGVGKTTLAKAIYNHFIGHKRFQAMSFLEGDYNGSIGYGPSLLTRLQEKLLWDLFQVQQNVLQSYEARFYNLSSQGRVLIILDDVLGKIQINELIASTSCLAHGSCIITTSRNQHHSKVDFNVMKLNPYIYEVTPLGSILSQKLFNWYAFGTEEAPDEYKVLANAVSNACDGLPLALKVVGTSLRDKKLDGDLEIWKEAINTLEGNLDIQTHFRWSYDRLSQTEQTMFVDIACVFHGWKKKEALEMWKNCENCCRLKSSSTCLRNLKDKYLITLEKDVLTMHCCLRELGQSIGNDNGSHVQVQIENMANDTFQAGNRVRALTLTSNEKQGFKAKHFAKLPKLHYLTLDGCNVSGSLPKVLRFLSWRHMPLRQPPSISNLSNLVSLNFSNSKILADMRTKSDSTFKGCHNLLRLNLSDCTELTHLPSFVGCLPRLQILNLNGCKRLTQLPDSVGELVALQELRLGWCESLQALPESITTLPCLQELAVGDCSSVLQLPPLIMSINSLQRLNIDLTREEHAIVVGQSNSRLEHLGVWRATDKAIAMLDTVEALSNLTQLSYLYFEGCPGMTKLPKSIGMLTNLATLELYKCEELRELPTSMEQLKVLTHLWLMKCKGLEALPHSLDALTSLQLIYIVRCTSITTLPSSIGKLTHLRELAVWGCKELESLPDSLKHLNELIFFSVMDCDRMDAQRVLQGFPMWGCTSITKLPRSDLMVVNGRYLPSDLYKDNNVDEYYTIHRDLKEIQVVEENDCGLLRVVSDGEREITQRVYKPPCCKISTM